VFINFIILSLSLIHLSELALQFVQVGTLHIVLLVFLLKYCQIFLNFSSLLVVELMLHAAEGLTLCLFGDLAFESLCFDAVL